MSQRMGSGGVTYPNSIDTYTELKHSLGTILIELYSLLLKQDEIPNDSNFITKKLTFI